MIAVNWNHTAIKLKDDIELPAPGFLWRTQQRDFVQPKNMSTHHLFYTLRMIWNHTMPAGARLSPYKQYSFGPHYTEAYMKESIRHLAKELATRTLQPEWQEELDHMIAWLARSQLSQTGQEKLT